MNSHKKEDPLHSELPDVLQLLPEEIQLAFFSYLESYDLGKTARVNKHWMMLSNDPSLWNFLLMQEFGLDYPKFLTDLSAQQPLSSATTNATPPLHPKEVYKFYKYFCNLCIELSSAPSLIEDDSFRNILAIRHPESLQKKIDNFADLASEQRNTLLCIYGVCDLTAITRISDLLDKIYQLAEQHFELAMLLISDHSGINNNNDVKISNRSLLYLLLKKHLSRISVVDLSTAAFTDASDQKMDFFLLFAELFAKEDSKVTKVTLATASTKSNAAFTYYCNTFLRMPNLRDIVLKCKADEFEQQIATRGPMFQALLQKHPNLQTITIVAINDASKVYTFQKAKLEENQDKMEIEEPNKLTPKFG